MKNVEMGRKFVGGIAGMWDKIENYEETDRNFRELEGKTIILAHNHFSLSDGPHGVANSLRFQSIRERDIEIAVTHYLEKYALIMNNFFGLRLGITGVVTPYLEDRMPEYTGRRSEGLLSFMKKVKSVSIKEGVIEIWPQATREQGPMTEPGKENVAMQGLLKLTKEYNSYVVPVGMWIDGINPEDVYKIHLRGYRFRYGKPISSGEINQQLKEKGFEKADDFEGADKLVYGMIKALLPKSYGGIPG